jgi:predicted SprT family Zn-dependent metalloprotease
MSGLRSKNSGKSKENQARHELERRILHGMACEWQAALLNLEPTKRQRMRRPLFAIKDMQTRWGNWSQEKREISLSRQLVLNYPWDSIRDVLLHETAHQIAQQLFGASMQRAHGPAFKQACEVLRIHPAASAAYQPLQDRFLQDHSSNYDKRMLRIKKLLALAESKNRFEADAARKTGASLSVFLSAPRPCAIPVKIITWPICCRIIILSREFGCRLMSLKKPRWAVF